MIGSAIDLARCLFDSSQDGLLQASVDTGRILDANPAAEHLTGLSREHLLRLQLDELLHGVDQSEDEFSDLAGVECAGLGRCDQPDLLVSVTRHEIAGDSESVELIIIRERRAFQPADYAGWIDPVIVTDATGHVAWSNAAFQQLTGRGRESIAGIPVAELIGDATQSAVLRRLEQVSGGDIEVVTMPDMTDAGGGLMATEMWSRPIDFDGRPAALSVIRDLTDQKRVEAFHAGQMEILEQMALDHELTPVLNSLIALIERLFMGTRGSVLLLDDDGVTLRHGAAPSLPDEYNALVDGLPSGACEGSCGTAVHRRERVVVFDIVTDPLWEQFRGLAEQFEHRACWSQPILDVSGNVLGTFALYYRQPRGPTSLEIELIENAAHLAGIAIRRSRSEQALRESQNETARQRQELEIILDAVQAQVVYMDTDARVVRHNRYSRELLGLSDDDIRGLNVIAQAPELDDPELRHEQSLEVIRTGQPRLGSVESYEEETGRRWVTIDKVPTFGESGEVNGLLLFIYDITKLKQAENLVRESEQRFRQLAENLGSAFWMSDETQQRIVYVSPPYERIFGRPCQKMYDNPEVFLESVEPEDRDRVRHKIERQVAGEATIEEYRIRRPDGSICWVRDQAFPIRDESGTIVRVAGLAEDVTEIRMAEGRLREHEARLGRVARLSTLGEMAASIVHELTQPLVAIRNFASVTDELAHNSDTAVDVQRLRASTQRIVQQTHRAGEIVARVRQLVTQSAPQRQAHDLNDLIRGTLNVLEIDLRNSSVQVETQLSPDAAAVRVDSIQIEQVLINVFRNAVDAMAGNSREDRRMRVASESFDGDVVVTIQDNGHGFGDQEPASLFEMFFTTRAHGMGVGLSISRTIVRAHGGRLEAEAAPQGGAVFRLTLPMLTEISR